MPYAEEEESAKWQRLIGLNVPPWKAYPESSAAPWVFRGTRMPVSAVFENLEDDLTIDQLVELYDGLTPEQVRAVLEFATRSLKEPALAE